MPSSVPGGVATGQLSIIADGIEVAHVPLRALCAEVRTVIVQPNLSVPQGGSVDLQLDVQVVAGPDCTVDYAIIPSSDLSIAAGPLPVRAGAVQRIVVPVAANIDVPLGARQGSDTAFLIGTANYDGSGVGAAVEAPHGLPLNITVIPAQLTVTPYVDGVVVVPAGGHATARLGISMHTTESTADVAFTSAGIPGLTMDPQTVVLHGAPQSSDDPPPNVDATGMMPFDLVLGGTANADPDRPGSLEVEWAAYHGQQTGSFRIPVTFTSPTKVRTRFGRLNEFGFRNSWVMSPGEIDDLRTRYVQLLDPVMSTLTSLIDDAISPIVGAATLGISTQVTASLRGTVEAGLAAIFGSGRGFCGGMAFTALDLFRAPAAMPDVGRLATQPTADGGDAGVLRDVIWHRLLDSIDANGATFIEYLAVTYYIPELIGGLLGALVGAAVAAEVGGVVNVITSGFSLVGSANIFVSVAGIIGGFLLGAKESTVAIDLGGAKQVLAWSSHAWDQLRAHLDAGEPWPLGLVAPHEDPTQSHQVVATGYDDLGPGKATVHFYDNSVDTFDVGVTRDWLSFDLTGDHFRVTGSSSPTWHDALGIVCEKYSAAMPPQLPTSPLPV